MPEAPDHSVIEPVVRPRDPEASEALRRYLLWSWPKWDGHRAHMVVAALKRPRKLTGVEPHGWDVHPAEVAVLGDGIRVTDPGRTLRDAIPNLDREGAVCLMDSALDQGLLKEEDITELNDRMRGRSG